MVEIKKAKKIIRFILTISIIFAIFLSIWEMNWLNIFLSVFTLILIFIPTLFEKKYKIEIPTSIELMIVLFLYAAIFLGEISGFYQKFWWWDSLLHFFSGIVLGLIGFMIMYILYKTEKFKASPKIMMIIVFCFALSIGTLWEITEFGLDTFLSVNTQKARYLCPSDGFCDSRIGVIDTMRDLILDSIGALIISIFGYFYLTKKKGFLIGNIIKSFEKENKKLFKKD